MTFLEIDPAYMPSSDPSRMARVCWAAREVLATFMEEPCEYELPDGRPLPPELACAAEDKDGLTVHETVVVPINARQGVSLTNVPHIRDTDGELMPVLEPGFVALRVEPNTPNQDDKKLQDAVGSDQIIFRLPIAGPAAIFKGFELDDAKQIAESDSRQLKRLERTLNFMRESLRVLMEQGNDDYDATYHAQVPRQSTGRLMAKWLESTTD